MEHGVFAHRIRLVPDMDAERLDAHRIRRDHMHRPENSQRLTAFRKSRRRRTAAAYPGQVANVRRMFRAHDDEIRRPDLHQIRHVEREGRPPTRVPARRFPFNHTVA